jgi:hypothetical protein
MIFYLNMISFQFNLIILSIAFGLVVFNFRLLKLKYKENLILENVNKIMQTKK